MANEENRPVKPSAGTLQIEKDSKRGSQASGQRSHLGRKYTWVLLALILSFLAIESFVPMRTAVQIGADEGFELAKATLCVHGHRLYTEIWNDQPPLHTFLVTEILKHASGSVLGPRLLTVAFSVLLLIAVFSIVRQVSGPLAASLTTAMIIMSPGFIELSWSCMLEIPALATALGALALLFCLKQGEVLPHPLALPQERENWATNPSMMRRGVNWWQTEGMLGDGLAGAAFGLGLQMKLVPVIYLVLVAFVFWAQQREAKRGLVSIVTRLAAFGIVLVAAYVGSDLLIERGAYLTHFQQSWKSHFGAVTASPEYGSPSEHPFDWRVLLKNWDVTVPAIIGVVVLIRGLRKVCTLCRRNESGGKELALTPALSPKEMERAGATPDAQFARASLRMNAVRNGRRRMDERTGQANDASTSPGGDRRSEGELSSYAALIVPLAWLALTFAVFGFHKPWWAYYYLHTAIPLCWCAGIGIAFLIGRVRGAKPEKSHEAAAGRRGNPQARTPALRRLGAAVALAAFGICSVGWMGARVYLQVANLRRTPQIENSPVITQMKRFKPFTDWLYADKAVYSFQADIPMVPSLAVMPVKRLWSGELNNEGIRRELTKYRPGLIVLLNDGRDVPFKDLLDAEYQMVYMDSDNRMYALKGIARKAVVEE
jgi:hypothetical protein